MHTFLFLTPMNMNWLLICLLFHLTQSWVPPGLNSHRVEPPSPELQHGELHLKRDDSGFYGNYEHDSGSEDHHDHKKEDVEGISSSTY